MMLPSPLTARATAPTPGTSGGKDSAQADEEAHTRGRPLL